MLLSLQRRGAILLVFFYDGNVPSGHSRPRDDNHAPQGDLFIFIQQFLFDKTVSQALPLR